MCAILVMCARAAAHDPPEVLRPFWTREGELVVLTNRGLIFGAGTDDTFRLMCTEAWSIGNSERPDLALLRDGGLMIASSAGLWRSEDAGCNWAGVEPFATLTSPALAQHASAPDTLYLATFAPGKGGIAVSRDAGASWELTLRAEDDDFIQELSVAPSDPAMVYASGYVFSNATERTHYIARSQDAGASWQRFELALLESETEVVLLAISPVDPMMLLARTIDRNPLQRLLLSRDGGVTFATVVEIELIHDASFGDDGRTLWVAAAKGLWRSGDGGEHFERLAGPLFMTSVIEHDGALWASGVFAEGQNGIGVSSDAGITFTPRMLFNQVTAPITCDAGARSELMCAVPWLDWQREILSPDGRRTRSAGMAGASGASRPGQGGGSGGADASGGVAVASGSSRGAGCAVGRPGSDAAPSSGGALASGGARSSGGALVLAVAGLAFRRRGRRRPSAARGAVRAMFRNGGHPVSDHDAMGFRAAKCSARVGAVLHNR